MALTVVAAREDNHVEVTSDQAFNRALRVGRWAKAAANQGPRGKRNLGFAEAQIAGVGSAPTRPELAALFDGFAE